MDILASFYTILSTVLAFQLLILFPLVIFLLFFPPGYIQAEFPAPQGHKETGTRIINVQKYPAARDIVLLIVIFLADIIFLYPYTQSGSLVEFSLLHRTTGVVFFCVQVAAAVGWSSLRGDWLAGERNFGLWGSKTWTVYYMTFILNSLACEGPMVFVGIRSCGEFVISQIPFIWHAFYHAYKPLLPDMQWPSFDPSPITESSK